MKRHKIETAEKTRCGQRIPPHLRHAPGSVRETWAEPDGLDETKDCATCFPVKPQPPPPPAPSAPKPGLRRLVAFSVRKNSQTGATTWVRAGSAAENRDGSFNVYLDVLPLDGKLHLRPDDGSKPEGV